MLFRLNSLCTLGWLFLASATALTAATYYVDPALGKMTNSGSASAPWSTLEAVFASNKTFVAGDVVVLRNGYHGTPTVKGHNAGTVTIRPEAGHAPKLRKLLFSNASRWTVIGLDISPLHAGATSYDTGKIVDLPSSCHNLTVQDCRIRSVFSVTGWTVEHWKTRLGNAISCGAPSSLITGNRIENVASGIWVGAPATGTVVAYNVIDTIRDDGFRGLANNCRFEYNTLRNMYSVDDNHDDAFQSWSNGPGGVGTGTVSNVQVRGNLFISYTDPNQPFKTAMQGIGLFDGTYDGWVIENNIIVTDQWHGISLFGARNCRVVNNTVVKNPINARTNAPWIEIAPHKNGASSSGNIVRNNLTTKLRIASGSATVSHNIVTSSFTSHFANYAGFDLRLRSGSSAINAGTTTSAPTIDADQNPRVAPYDVGAFEVVAVATVAAPVASPGGGSYTSAQSVSLTTSTSGATIRYTLDGSTPTASQGIIYGSPVAIAASCTLKAVAYKTGLTTSPVTTLNYTITAPTSSSTSITGSTVAFEAEDLSYSVSGATGSVRAETGASGGEVLFLWGNSVSDAIELTTGTVKAGTYVVKFRYKKERNRAVHTAAVNGKTLGTGIDQYASTASFAEVTLGTVTIATGGAQKLRLAVTGKNPSSSGYWVAADRLTFVAQ